MKKNKLLLLLSLSPLFCFGQWTTSGTNIYNQQLDNSVGIGTTTPNGVLELKRAANPNFKVSSSTTSLEIGIATSNAAYSSFANTSSAVIRVLGSSGPTKNMIFSTATTVNSGSSITFASESDILMKINDNKTISMGNVTAPAGYFLYVEKGILTEKLKIAVKSDAVNWSDFVFKKNYNLRSLYQVEKFINKNGHLPEIPSAQKIYKEGIDVAEMDAKLLTKIEELTLYLIELKKENEVLRKDLETLKSKLK